MDKSLWVEFGLKAIVIIIDLVLLVLFLSRIPK